ncbi:hypothetical protein ABTJ92_20735, partial [Acinetobacter baumannii]
GGAPVGNGTMDDVKGRDRDGTVSPAAIAEKSGFKPLIYAVFFAFLSKGFSCFNKKNGVSFI